MILMTSSGFAFISFSAVGYFANKFSAITSVTSSLALALKIVEMSTLNGSYFTPIRCSIVLVPCVLARMFSTLQISRWVTIHLRLRSSFLFVGILHLTMKTYRSLKLISIANLKEAYEKARKRKSRNQAVQEFDKHWQLHLVQLYKELKTGTYSPKPLKTFILRDPKTRTISVSDFRDRVVHHALVNVLQPIFEPRFIVDSYASRKGKGTTAALDRFYLFLRQVTRNGRVLRGAENKNTVVGFAFKADIKSYFDSVDHDVLFGILSKRVKDESVLWLIQKILDNYTSGTSGKGMPLGNWTSQFFANVYLNELDQFVKHQLKAKYYLRYVDDFIIVHSSKITLQEYEHRVNGFLKQMLFIELHSGKSKIIRLGRRVNFLGFRVFYYHRLLKKQNVRKMRRTFEFIQQKYSAKEIRYDEIYDFL